mmetsp:Transcript_60411/g.144022  ORF Transcript_60411/g.144022 Transcript_60411/m.144022 type:complete len:528 (-) Transcript_60411:110-1693(-)
MFSIRFRKVVTTGKLSFVLFVVASVRTFFRPSASGEELPFELGMLPAQPHARDTLPSEITSNVFKHKMHEQISLLGFLHPSNWMVIENLSSDLDTKMLDGVDEWKSCPKIYIYNKPNGYDFDSDDITQLSLNSVFGPIISDAHVRGLRETWQLNLAHVMTFRILHSSCHTNNPHEADLFMMPFAPNKLVPDSHRMEHWEPYMRGDCYVPHHIEEFRQWFHYLNESTVRKHFIVHGYHWPVSRWACLFRSNASSAKESIGMLAQVPWVNVEPRFEAWQGQRFPLLEKQPRFEAFKCGAKNVQAAFNGMTFDNMGCHDTIISAPRTSCMHWNRQLLAQHALKPWREHVNRKDVLLSYIGRRARRGESRWPVQQLCNKYLNSTKLVCHTFNKRKAPSCKDIYELKARSMFCLDPTGDTPARRSTADSYAVGCIPVFIGVIQAFTYPDQWQGWHDTAFLVVDEDFFQDQSNDVVRMLERLPQEAIGFMQAKIAVYAHRFVYNEEELPNTIDGIDFILRSLYARSLVKSKSM